MDLGECVQFGTPTRYNETVLTCHRTEAFRSKGYSVKEPTRDEKIESLRHSIRLMVAGGFESRSFIFDVANEEARYDFPNEAIELLVREMVEEEFEKHFHEQVSWPAITDCDKLDSAFAELNRAGIVARQHFSCCGTCAAAEIRLVMDQIVAEGTMVRGYTSYDIQSTESAAGGYGIGLNYGSAADGEAAALSIGHDVVETLTRQGLVAEWDGSWAHRITVKLDWKRRRDTAEARNGE